MDRRKFITAASTIGVTVVAGCLDSGSTGSETSQDTLEDTPSETSEDTAKEDLSINAPNAILNWTYDAETGRLQVYHAGGDTINPENTQEIRLTEVNGQDLASTPPTWGSGLSPTEGTDSNSASAKVEGTVETGDLVATLGNMGSDGSVSFVWVAINGKTSATVGAWEGPDE